MDSFYEIQEIYIDTKNLYSYDGAHMLTQNDVQDHNPDQQAPMPFKAADDYARQVMAWAGQVPTGDMDVHRDIAFGEHRLQRYNVFSPAGARHAPVLVCWHGGGWTHGYRDYVSFMAPHVTALGCVLVAPSYRLAPGHRLPCGFEDAVQALAHVSAHAASFGGNGQRLYLSGHSAGAHLAALVALRVLDRARAGVPQDAVRACLPVSGIMDLYHPAPPAGSLEERVYTMVLGDPMLDAVMSPLCWTVGNALPFALSFGEHDSERVQRSNRRMAELLKLQPGKVELTVRAGQDHFQTHTTLNGANHPWYASFAALLEGTV